MKLFYRRALPAAMLLSLLLAVAAGCGTQADQVLSLVQEETALNAEESAGTGNEQGASDEAESAGDDGKQEKDVDAENTEVTSGPEEDADDAGGLTNAADRSMAVYICGAVTAPGVYEVTGDMRLADAVELAGGFLADADTTWWNLAVRLTDGAMYYIPTVSETAEESFSLWTGEGEGDSGGASGGSQEGDESADGGQTGGQTGSTGENSASDGLISINTATKEELTKLPGIGDTKAAAIITYRETNGPFTAIDEIMNVTGIGESTYEKLKDYICL